jgi:hypothetical protein
VAALQRVGKIAADIRWGHVKPNLPYYTELSFLDRIRVLPLLHRVGG